MKHYLNIIFICFFILGVSVLAQAEEDVLPESSNSSKNFWTDWQLFSNKSKDLAEKSKSWVKSDISAIGDWEYHLVRISSSDDEKIIEELNALGSQRWEVIWIQPEGDDIRFFMKRVKRTYIRHIPMAEMWRLLPEGTAE